uniref:Uncharacterized protein n=1 Tax=Labrus bergylta TaxID=56723 RepID=A0A3Q3E789_9LABR
MSFAVCAIALLCLVSVSCSTPLTCDDLVRPLDQVDLSHLEGGWALVAGTLMDPVYLERYKTRHSAMIKFSQASDNSSILMDRLFLFDDGCEYFASNFTLEGSSYTSKRSNLTVTFMQTSCPDCLLMRFVDSGKLRNMYLFSRRREVEQKDMEEFRAQSKCVKGLPPAMMDPTKELCPDRPSDQPALESQ